MLWMHDPTTPIGVWLSVAENTAGLAVEGRLALRTQKGGEAYELLKLGALSGLSIGYRVVSSRTDARTKARLLTDIDLFEISLVTFPANDAARVSAVKGPTRSAGAMGAVPAVQTDRRLIAAAAARLREAARTITQKA